MPITSPIGFLSAYLDSNECELFADDKGEIIAYIPTRENWQAQLGLSCTSYAEAEIKAREIGLEPNWN